MVAPDFHNVDLDIESRSDLTILATELGRNVMNLGPGPVSPGCFLLRLEIVPEYKTPDEVTCAFCSLLERLSPKAKRVWHSAHKKEFDVGHEVVDGQLASQFSLRTETLKRLSALGATLGITFYDYSKRTRQSEWPHVFVSKPLIIMKTNRLPPIHPGKILREEFMLPRGLSQNALARALHVPPRRINEIVLEKRGITADTALRLARYFGTSAEMWTGLQADYDLRLARLEKTRVIERDVEPLAALQLGVPFPKYVSRAELMQRLKREILSLSDDDLVWWEAHKAKPFPVIHGDRSHFVVAVAGHDVLFFADDEDEFGVAKLVSGRHTLTDNGLVGDLKDAVRGIRKNRLHN